MLLHALKEICFFLAARVEEFFTYVIPTEVMAADGDGAFSSHDEGVEKWFPSTRASFPQKKLRTTTPSGQNSGSVIL